MERIRLVQPRYVFAVVRILDRSFMMDSVFIDDSLSAYARFYEVVYNLERPEDVVVLKLTEGICSREIIAQYPESSKKLREQLAQFKMTICEEFLWNVSA